MISWLSVCLIERKMGTGKHAQRCHLIRERNGSYDNIVLVTCVRYINLGERMSERPLTPHPYFVPSLRVQKNESC